MLSLERLTEARRIYGRLIELDPLARHGDEAKLRARVSNLVAEAMAELPVLNGVIGAMLEDEPVRAAVARTADHKGPAAPVCLEPANDDHANHSEQPGPRLA